MKKYIKDYLKHHGLVVGDIVRCEDCQRQDYIENMNLHHIIYKSRGGTDDPDNLQILCFSCHYEIHNK